MPMFILKKTSNIFATEYSPAKTEDWYSSDIPQFSQPRVLQKKHLKDNKHNI